MQMDKFYIQFVRSMYAFMSSNEYNISQHITTYHNISQHITSDRRMSDIIW